MNKTIIIAGAVIVLLFVGGFFFLNNKQSQPEKTEIAQQDTVSKDEGNTASSRYAPYSKSVLDQAVNTRRVLFFYANWCPTCRPADENFSANVDKIPENVTLIRVNYNDPDTDAEEKDLAKQYGITYQHTFVQIDQQGKEVTKWNGGQIDELLANIK